MILRKLRHVWVGGVRCRTRYLDTAPWDINMPTFTGSPCPRERPRADVAVLMVRIIDQDQTVIDIGILFLDHIDVGVTGLVDGSNRGRTGCGSLLCRRNHRPRQLSRDPTEGMIRMSEPAPRVKCGRPEGTSILRITHQCCERLLRVESGPFAAVEGCHAV